MDARTLALLIRCPMATGRVVSVEMINAPDCDGVPVLQVLVTLTMTATGIQESWIFEVPDWHQAFERDPEEDFNEYGVDG